jgi:hypothetical protein
MPALSKTCATKDASDGSDHSKPAGIRDLSDDYVTTATQDVALQLSKAGVRLAFVLNNALRKQ